MEHSAPLGGGPSPRLLISGGSGSFRPSPFESILLLIALLVGGFIGYSAYSRLTDLNKKPPTPATYLPAFRTTLTSTVAATGTVSSTQQVSLNFDIGQGTGTITNMFVKLGDQVTQGQPLAQIDDTELKQSVRFAQANLTSAQARYSAIISPHDADIASAQQAISSATSQIATAQQNLTNLLTGPKAGDLASAQQAVTSAQSSVTSSQGTLTSAQNNLSKGQNQILTDQNAIASAQNDLNTAQINLNTNALQVQSGISQLSAAILNCGATPSLQTPVFIRGQQAQLAQLPPGFGLGISTQKCTNDTSGSAQTNLGQQISSYNGAATAYNTALAGLTSKQVALSNAQTTLTNDQNSIASLQASVQSAQAGVGSSQSGVTSAQAKLSDLTAPPKDTDVTAAQSTLDSANSSLASAQAKYSALLKPTQDVTAPLEASVEQARDTLATAQQNLDAATITAPFDGQISQLTGDVGTVVNASTVVFVELNPKLVRIDANVDQAFIADLKQGQQATITFDALPNRSYQATVTNIGLTPVVQQGVVSYVVNLGLDTSRLPDGTPVPTPGMTANITVTTSQTSNALVVPQRAVRRVGRNQTVTVHTATADETRVVTTGATNGTLLQITNGLQEGDLVLVSAPAAAARPATTTGPGGPAVGP